MTALAFYAGPLPPAREFAAYEAACPGSADRILRMAEENQSALIRETTTQAEHRRSLEAQVIPANISADRRGQCFALVVALAGLVSATALGLWGSQWAAAAVGVTSLGSLVGIFITERVKGARQLAQKKAEQDTALEQQSGKDR